jgi:RNA polymerase sigma factor (sigma-70 family)
MENILALSNQSISDVYKQYAHSIFFYIYYKVKDEELARDLMQDTFLRLLSCREEICFYTVKHLLYIIARNLVNDYLRRYYRTQEITTYLYENAELEICETESFLYTRELAVCELDAVSRLPMQRRKVYELTRFEKENVAEIAKKMNISRRTVENHLRMGRMEVRDYIRKCI